MRLRLGLLEDQYPPKMPYFGYPERLTTASAEETMRFMEKAIDAGCEGLMIKILDSPSVKEKKEAVAQVLALDEKEAGEKKEEEAVIKSARRLLPPVATYEPDKRSDAWMKLKKDYTALGDTIDVVPIGAWHGQGRCPFCLC